MQTFNFRLVNGTTVTTSSFDIAPVNVPIIFNDSIVNGNVISSSTAPVPFDLVPNVYHIQLNAEADNDWYIQTTGSTVTASAAIVSGSYSTGVYCSVTFDNLISTKGYGAFTNVDLTPITQKNVGFNDSFILADKVTYATDATGSLTVPLVPQAYWVKWNDGERNKTYKILVPNSSSVDATLCIVTSTNVAKIITPKNQAEYTYTAEVIDEKIGNITYSGSLSSSFASASISSSYSQIAGTASFIKNAQTASLAVSASWAPFQISSSFATTAGVANSINFVPSVAVSASFASASISSSYSKNTDTASYLLPIANLSASVISGSSMNIAGLGVNNLGQLSVQNGGTFPNNAFYSAQFGNAIAIEGLSAGFQIADRVNSAHKWQHYSLSDFFRIWNSSGNEYFVMDYASGKAAFNLPTSSCRDQLSVGGNISCSVITASLHGNADTATTSSFAQTASFITASKVVGTVTSASYTVTASVLARSSSIVDCAIIDSAYSSSDANYNSLDILHGGTAYLQCGRNDQSGTEAILHLSDAFNDPYTSRGSAFFNVSLDAATTTFDIDSKGANEPTEMTLIGYVAPVLYLNEVVDGAGTHDVNIKVDGARGINSDPTNRKGRSLIISGEPNQSNSGSGGNVVLVAGSGDVGYSDGKVIASGSVITTGFVGINIPNPKNALDVKGLIGNSAGLLESQIDCGNAVLIDDANGAVTLDWEHKILSGSWSGSITFAKTASAAGSQGQIQFNNGGILGSVPNLYVDLANSRSVVQNDYQVLVTGSAGDTTSNLILYYKLDEGTGSIANDSSGNGHNGTLEHSPAWVSGMIGSHAIKTQTTNDLIRLSPPMQMTGSWTISTWTLFPQSVLNTALTRDGAASGSGNIHVATTGHVLGVYMASDGTAFHSSGYDTSVLSGWHLITAVGSGGITTFYVDAAFVGTSSAQAVDNLDTIGNNIQDSNQPWGTFDDFRIYTRALGQTDINALYAYRGGVTSGYVADNPSGSAVGLFARPNNAILGVSNSGSFVIQSLPKDSILNGITNTNNVIASFNSTGSVFNVPITASLNGTASIANSAKSASYINVFTASTSPSNPSSIAGWVNVSVQGAPRWMPFYN